MFDTFFDAFASVLNFFFVITGESYGGACWTVVKVRINQLIFYRYPADEQWRPILTGVLLLILGVIMMMVAIPLGG